VYNSKSDNLDKTRCITIASCFCLLLCTIIVTSSSYMETKNIFIKD